MNLAPGSVKTLDETAAIFGRHRATIKYWIDKGILPATKIGKSWYIKTEDIEALLDGAA